MKPRRIVSTVDLTTDGFGDLSVEQLADETLQLVRRDHSGRLVAALAVLASELSGLSDIAGLALCELNAQPVSARSPGSARLGPDRGAAQ